MQQITIWNYSSINRESKFVIIILIWKVEVAVSLAYFVFSTIIMPRHFKSREPVKLILIQAESKVMQGCFYWRKCEDCKKLFEIENECKIKGLLTFNKVVMNWKVAFRGQNKHFKIMQRNWFWIFYILVNPVNETANGQMLEKANMLFVTKETPDKDWSLKTQLLLATDLQKTEKISVS